MKHARPLNVSPVVLQGVMADSGASCSGINPSNTKRRSKSEGRKIYEKKRDASRAFLFDAFERWRAFREEYNLKTDQNVANFLLDYHARRNKLWYAYFEYN